MYRPETSREMPIFSGIRTFMHLPHSKTKENIDFAILGHPFDTGVTFATGTRFGPEAIRSRSTRLHTYNPGLDIDVFDYLSGVDSGDMQTVPGYTEETYDMIQKQLVPYFQRGIVPIILGGDHGISLPHLRAAAEVFGPVSLLHFDAHSDTWDTSYGGKKYTHATMFRRAVEEGIVDTSKSIQIGMRLYSKQDLEEQKGLGYEVITGLELHEIGTKEVIKRARQRIGNSPTFLTFDIDFLDPAYAPGTGTPEVGGFTIAQALELLRGVAGSNFIGFDLVEVLPDRDPTGVTALNAAHIAFEFLSLLAYKKRANELVTVQEESLK
ncbi:agmatinase [Metabacillus litoralis]|uniref:agmatinase n=1 Tax=Metabacillus litoralis TaxID=152268 RepID=UPI00203F43FB|nr:agmatinase [Metabacillus litoralis]MCM3161041.1 agmatinase [Metabacillus litoralis]